MSRVRNNLAQNVMLVIQELFSFVVYNFFLLFLIGFFTYRTFFVGRLNWALLVLLVALFLMICCRVVATYRQSATATYIYRFLVLLSVGLLIAALVIQTLRFINVFLPTLENPTLSKILVRIGIVTVTFYCYALFIALIYHLYTHQMLKLIWNGSLEGFLDKTFLTGHYNVQQIRFSNHILLLTGFVGGAASVITLAVGFVAWLVR